MSNTFYNPSGVPAFHADLSSADIRAEFQAIQAGFDKMPGLTGNGGKIVVVNPAGTALIVDDAPPDAAALLKTFAGKGGNISHAVNGPLNINTLDGQYFQASAAGGTQITGIAKPTGIYDGRKVTVRFAAAGFTLVHSATFKLPDGVNITTHTDDVGEFVYDAGVWSCTSYESYNAPDAPKRFFVEDTASGYTAVYFSTSGGTSTFDGSIAVSGGSTTQNGMGNMVFNAGRLLYGSSDVDAFPSGTQLVCGNAAAPAGWSIVSGLTDRTLVFGTGGATGGNAGESIPAGLAAGNVPLHTHPFSINPAKVNTVSTTSHTHIQGTAKTTTTSGGSFSITYLDPTGNTDATTATVAPAQSVDLPAISGTTGNNTGGSTWLPIWRGVILIQKN